jgi:hypothetical protein
MPCGAHLPAKFYAAFGTVPCEPTCLSNDTSTPPGQLGSSRVMLSSITRVTCGAPDATTSSNWAGCVRKPGCWGGGAGCQEGIVCRAVADGVV